MDNTAKGATVLAAVCIGVPLLYFTAGAGGPVLASYLLAHGGAIGAGLVGAGGASAAAVNELADGDDDEVRTGQGVQRALDRAGSRAVHGNSAASPRTSYLYRLSSKTGEYLKTGISQDPSSRYTRAFMRDKEMEVISSGAMLALERNIVEVDPGRLNLERWAGNYSWSR